MIGRLTGVILEKQPLQLVVDVKGVGYEISVPMSTFCELPEIGSSVSLFTHFVVREDMQLLFGFSTESERQMFRQLVKISGIGVRTALALLSKLSVQQLQNAVELQDSARLVSVPGVGKKTAERLLLELRGKLDSAKIVSGEGALSSAVSINDIGSALISLGYSDREVSWAVKQLTSAVTVTDGIRQALQLLSKETN